MKKVLFVHIEKTAGGSIEKWFKQNSVPLLYFRGHKTLYEILDTNDGLEFDLSFCVVRNSYRRLISYYNWIPIKARKELKRQKSKFWEDYLEAHNKGIIYFLDFYQDYFKSKNQVIYSKEVDLVLKYENLIEEFKIIQSKVNCFEPLYNTKHVLNYNYEEFYNKKYFKKVEQICQEEIEYFNYTPYN